MEKTAIETIQELSDGYSRQSKVANQMWLGFIITSIWALTDDKYSETGTTKLPFSLGTVNEATFLMGCVLIICVFVIAYCSATIQSVRTRRLIDRVILGLKEDERFINGIHIQDYTDSILSPSYGKVAPISQFLLGKKQFMGDQEHQNPTLRLIAFLFFLCLKFVAFGFTYIIPFYAIWDCYQILLFDEFKFHFYPPLIITTGLILVTTVSVMILFIGETKNLSSVFSRIKS